MASIATDGPGGYQHDDQRQPAGPAYPYLACALPCERFTSALADTRRDTSTVYLLPVSRRTRPPHQKQTERHQSSDGKPDDFYGSLTRSANGVRGPLQEGVEQRVAATR